MVRFAEYYRLLYGETIGWLSGKRVVKKLTAEEYKAVVGLLAHWKTNLRWLAADRLGKLGDERAVEPLIVALHDGNWLVRLHAAKALGRIGSSIAIEPLLEMKNDKCPYVRRRVVTALGQLHAKITMRALETYITALSDPDKGTQLCAGLVVSDNVSLQGVYALADAAREQGWDASFRTIMALERMVRIALIVLIELLECPRSDVRTHVAWALKKLERQYQQILLV